SGSGPVLRAVPRVAPFQHDSSNRQVVLNRSELATLLAVDGHRTTYEIVSGGEPVQALHTLTTLSDAGVIELKPSAPPAVEISKPPEPTEQAVPPAPAMPGKSARRRAALIREVAQLAVLTVLFTIALRGIVHSVHVQGQSMLPGLRDGQLLLV